MYLNTHSYYSFKYGCISPEELLKNAQERGIFTLALTDINSTAGCLEFVKEAPKYGIRPVVGVDFRNGIEQLYIAIARNNQGFLEINTYLSQFLSGAHAEADERNDEAVLKGPKQIPLRAPESWENVEVIYPAEAMNRHRFSLRFNEWVGVKPQYLRTHQHSGVNWPEHRGVALATATFRHKRDFNVHRLLRAIAENALLSKLPASLIATEEDRIYASHELTSVYKTAPHLLLNAGQLIGRCSIEFDFTENRPHQNLQTYTGSMRHDIELLRKLCSDGLAYRYGEVTDTVKIRLNKELEAIISKDFVSYFLINWDILGYARSRNYFYVGRGSGANSVVAYLLRITDVDPIELDLYFERFINLFRKSPPDFDIDFSWRDREDVTRYIFSRFPTAALLATYNTFQFRSVVRELGKVFGFPSVEIEEMAFSESYNANRHTNDLAQKIKLYGELIHNFPSHLSIHAGGVLISQKPIHYFTATHLPPKGFPTTQFDMVIAEDVGLYKFDILSQRGLGKIKDTLSIISQNHPSHKPIDIHDLKKFKADGKVKDMLKEGKTIGCFYVESPSMRMLLKKLRVDDYLGLVAASSIIRPGVAKSGMMREYILRFRFPEKRKEAHPVMLDIMPETFGVMVYQEDVIKVAHLFAGLSLAEADVLRRGMSGKYRSREEFQQVKDRFFDNCRKKSIDEKTIREVWHQIESFAGYAFSKGHSASYAVESYQSLFLKAYYPLEYMVATLNNGGGFYKPELYAHEAKMHGAVIEAPCVNNSNEMATIRGTTIWIGLNFIKGLESQTVQCILTERARHGVFTSLEDLTARCQPALEQLTLLLRVGALRFTGKSKQLLLWEAHYLHEKTGGGKARGTRQAGNLFAAPVLKEFQLPQLTVDAHDDAHDELDLLGFALCNPFSLLKKRDNSYCMTSQLTQQLGNTVTMLGHLVAVKDTTTSKGLRMQFGTFIDEEGSFIDTTHFPDVAAQYPFRGTGFYKLKGRVVEEFGFFSLEVAEMHKEALLAKIP